MVQTLDGAVLAAVGGDPVCAGCGGDQFRSCGAIHGRRQLGCVACGKRVLLAADAPDLPCPYCGAQCVKDGKCKAQGKTWAQRYLCRACGHHSSELYPATRLEDLGGYLYRMGLGLDLGAKAGLHEFCQKFRMRDTEGVRAVFRASRFAVLELPARSGFLARVAGREGGGYVEPVRSAAAVAAGLPIGDVVWGETSFARLPDARSEVSRARCAGRLVRDMCGERTVGVVYRVSVALDRAAMAGLLRAMTFLDTRNRQTAARFLLTDALARFGGLVVLPVLRGTNVGRFT